MSVRGAYHGCTHIAESLDTGERIESSSTDARLPDPGVAHLLRETHPTLRVESRVFPAYQTRGELVSATMESPQAILLAVCVSLLGCICESLAHDADRRDTRVRRLVDDTRGRPRSRSWCWRRSGEGQSRADGSLVRPASIIAAHVGVGLMV